MMNDHVSPPASLAREKDGRLTRLMKQWFVRTAQVEFIQDVTPAFRLIGLQGDALRNAEWKAGQKIQICVGPGLTFRTYTPISWDKDSGKTRFLVYRHGQTPACQWVMSLAVGDSCELFGPRPSTDNVSPEQSLVLLGDETSFGLAAALTNPLRILNMVFEVSNVTDSVNVLETLGISNAVLVKKKADNSHLTEVIQEAIYMTAADSDILLTGKASSIQHIKKAFKAIPAGPSRIVSKAYWAEGKVGLD